MYAKVMKGVHTTQPLSHCNQCGVQCTIGRACEGMAWNVNGRMRTGHICTSTCSVVWNKAGKNVECKRPLQTHL